MRRRSSTAVEDDNEEDEEDEEDDESYSVSTTALASAAATGVSTTALASAAAASVSTAALASAAAIATSQKILENRVIEKTKDKYRKTLNFMARQCLTICPDAVDDVGPPVVLHLPMSLENIQILFGVMGAERENKSVKSKSAVTGYISSLKFAYRENDIRTPDDQLAFFKSYSDGYKRIVASKKQDGIMKQHEGKVSCTYLLYVRLAQLALFATEVRSKFSAFVHVFLVLCWNLFARSISVCELRTHHFSWENDMMVIDLSKVSNNNFFIIDAGINKLHVLLPVTF